uniref:FAD_binding_3 domain-containing protein n=1 Tax=Meloidogyne hapla TaxID=6305 RepID=A0A1I8BW58_MELHA
MRGKAKMFLLPFNLFCLAWILASLFDKNVAYNEDKLMATIQQNLIYASFPSDRPVLNFEKTRYQFNRANGFEDWRLKQLVNIIEKDINGMPRGSTQSNDVLIYDEWEYIQNPENIQKGGCSRVFGNAVANLTNKINEFMRENDLNDPENVRNQLKNYDEMTQSGFEVEEQSHSKKKGKRKGCLNCFKASTSSHPSSPKHSENTLEHLENLIKLVIECKEFIRDIHSEERQQSDSPSTSNAFKGSEGSFIDIFSFMEKDTEMSGLKNIFELSKIQTRKLDQAINGRIYEEHKRKIGEYKNAIVQGAGPVGLYATYKLFIEGVNVTLVNDRPEEYIRNRVVFFDRKWMSQLRFFLGTKFDKLFIVEERQNDKEYKPPLGRWLDEDIGLVNIKNMETALKDRLKELSEYIKEKEEGKNPQEKSFLNLIYNTAVLDIDTENYQNPMAILGAPVKRSGSFNVEKLKEVLNGIRFFEHNDKLAIPFDLFFCAGGAKDQIRNKFLEKAEQLTESVNYGVAIFDKVKHDVKVFEDDAVFYRDNMAGMEEHLENQKIDELISGDEFISAELKSKYEKINELIIYGMEMDYYGNPKVEDGQGNIKPKKEYEIDDNGNIIRKTTEQVVVRLFEINPTLHIASITPEALVKFIEEFKEERENATGNENLLKQYDNFHEKLQKKWAKALFEYTFSVRHEKFKKRKVAIEDGEASSSISKGQILKYDPHSANTSTFDVAIYGIENPVNYVRSKEEASTSEISETRRQPIIAAIGDANTSAHFMTASGISTGKFLIHLLIQSRLFCRWAVESAVNVIRHYNQNPGGYLLELLNFVLREVRRRVLEKAREYVQVFDHVKFDLNTGLTIQQFDNRA